MLILSIMEYKTSKHFPMFSWLCFSLLSGKKTSKYFIHMNFFSQKGVCFWVGSNSIKCICIPAVVFAALQCAPIDLSNYSSFKQFKDERSAYY